MMLMCYETKQGNHATFVELQQKKRGFGDGVFH
jgi:hypothetical protein